MPFSVPRSALAIRRAGLAFALAVGCSEPAAECGSLPQECTGTPPSYQNDIAGIVRVRCSGCHNPLDPSGPWPFETRSDLSDWRDQVSRDIQSCAMPPPGSGMPLPDDERALLNAWLVCGAPDN